jgi:hypothetical protein
VSNDKIKSLEEKLKALRAELKKEILKVIEDGVSDLVTETLAQFGITGEVAVITWDFEDESDDEGGTDYWPTGYELSVNGENIDIDEFDEEDEDDIYLRDYLADILCSYQEDLYSEYVTSIDVKLD